jgi:hypothetical protein
MIPATDVAYLACRTRSSVAGAITSPTNNHAHKEVFDIMFESQSRTRWRAGLATLAALVAIVAAPALMASAASTVRVGHSIVLYLAPDRSSAVLVPAPGVSKQTYSASRDLQTLGVRLGPQSTTSSPGVSSISVRGGMRATAASADIRASSSGNTLYASNSIGTCPPGGQCSSTGVWFSTTVNAQSGWWVATITFGPGQSQGAWWGCCPWNADVMYLSDNWSVAGLGVSVSIPAGIGFSGSGSSASWSGSASNQWLINHSFNGIQFSSWFALCCPSESASTTSQFGGSFFSTTANS